MGLIIYKVNEMQMTIILLKVAVDLSTMHKSV